MQAPVVISGTSTSPAALTDETIINDEGTSIPLSLLLSSSITSGYKQLFASDKGEIYPINISNAHGKEKHIIGFASRYSSTHAALRVNASGAYFDSQEFVKKMIWILATSIILLFLILAMQFESLVQPLIILSEIIIDVFLVLLVLYIAGQSLNAMSMIGLIVMSGIVINDSILKIDTINRHRKTGMSLLRAIAAAGRERLVPIIMTSLTTILAMLPFMRGGNIGSDLQFPLSLAIIVGMAVGTMVSIFFIPLAYYAIYSHQKQPSKTTTQA